MNNIWALMLPSLLSGVFVLVGIFVTKADRRKNQRDKSDNKVREVEAGAYQRAQVIDTAVVDRLTAEVKRLEARENERDAEILALTRRVILLERTLRSNNLDIP